MITKVKLILPIKSLSNETIEKAVNACLHLQNQTSNETLEVYSNDESSLDYLNVNFLKPKSFKLEGFEYIVCIYGYDIPPIEGYTSIPDGHFFWLNNNFQITTPDGKYNEALTPGNKTHFFNKALPNDVAAFGYFPYIDLIRDQRLRPISSLGYRNKENPLSFKKNINSERIIIILGGSTAQGTHVNYEETFGFLLEQHLNNHLKSKYKFKVLNFAMSGHLVTDEFITFFSFCEHFNPDLVITFDGLNDLFNGSVNDPYLINEWMYSYRHQLEERAIFFNGPNNNLAENEVNRNLKIKNEINIVVDTYLYRLRQLHSYFKARNIKSIGCLQPHIYSKKALSRDEQEFISKNDNNPNRSDVAKVFDLKLIPQLYDNVSKKFKKLNFDTLNFHTLFRNLDEGTSVFFDRVHFNDNGEKFIANLLFDYIKKNRITLDE